jgi:chromosome segregation ATPase
MQHVLKALDSQLELLEEDLDWHKNEMRVYKDKSFEQSKEIKNLREEKEVLMKRIQELQDVIQTIKEGYKNK